MPASLPADLDRTLSYRLRSRQRTWRAPGLIAGVVRDGELVWSHGIGASDVLRPDEPPTPDTAFAVGSITKTFTATLIMTLRDEGKLTLDTELGTLLPASKRGGVRIRELLAHASGLQREPPGDMWVTLDLPSIDAVVADIDSAEQVLPSRLRWHYSNPRTPIRCAPNRGPR